MVNTNVLSQPGTSHLSSNTLILTLMVFMPQIACKEMRIAHVQKGNTWYSCLSQWYHRLPQKTIVWHSHLLQLHHRSSLLREYIFLIVVSIPKIHLRALSTQGHCWNYVKCCFQEIAELRVLHSYDVQLWQHKFWLIISAWLHIELVNNNMYLQTKFFKIYNWSLIDWL